MRIQCLFNKEALYLFLENVLHDLCPLEGTPRESCLAFF